MRALAGEDAAIVFAALLALRRAAGARETLSLKAFSGTAAFGADHPDRVRERLGAANDAFNRAFGIKLLVERDPELEALHAIVRPPASSGNISSDAVVIDRDRFATTTDILDLIGRPLPRADTHDLPVADSTTATWIATVRSAAKTAGGFCFALRVAGESGREVRDVAGLLAQDGTRVEYGAEPGYQAANAMILRAELHAGVLPHVVVLGSEALFANGFSDTADSDEYVEPSSWIEACGGPFDAILDLTANRTLRNIYVWRAPAAGVLPRRFDGFVGGIIGPLGYDRAWAERIVAAMMPQIGPAAISALLEQVHDPRDVGAMAKAAQATAGQGLGLDEACTFVARSFGARPGGFRSVPPPPLFDLRLMVCDQDLGLLIERADHLGRSGGRILFWGPPGGGKSSAAVILARSMGAGRPTIVVAPADILAPRWGDMERRLTALWSRAASEGAVLLIDEIDAICGMREAGATGNASLVRTLTDEFLRAFDRHHVVPVVATVNDPLAVDNAVRRRFAFVVEVRDELPPDRETMAWGIMFGIRPPSGWIPCGAAVSDFAMAKARCRMLGLHDARSMADALLSARNARLGIGGRQASQTSRGPVH